MYMITKLYDAIGRLFFPSAFWERGYGKGRLDGWFACEKMILDRAGKNREKVWKELLE